MPYTKSELETVSFYQDFVTKLRDKYLGEIKTFLNNKFRRDGILYSFAISCIITGFFGFFSVK